LLTPVIYFVGVFAYTSLTAALAVVVKEVLIGPLPPAARTDLGQFLRAQLDGAAHRSARSLAAARRHRVPAGRAARAWSAESDSAYTSIAASTAAGRLGFCSISATT